MTIEAVQLIHELATPAKALAHLKERGLSVSDDALEHILDFHLAAVPAMLRHFRDGDWLWLHAELAKTIDRWTEELPADIGEHRLTRVDQEEKAQKILLFREFAAIIAARIPNQ